MIKVLETSIDLDLSLFSRYLWQMGISHRIFEESGQQQLCVKTSEQADAVLELYKEYLSGELKLEAAASADIPEGPSTLQRVLMQMRLYPGTMIFILISAVLYPLSFGLDTGEPVAWLHWFTYTDFIIQGEHILFAPLMHGLKNGEIWRLWTPMFLHFGLMHIVFNMLWLWEIGRRMEVLQGSWRIFNVVMATAAISNLAQFLVSEGSLFGGMSGVVYGLLGYSLVWSRMRPERSFGLPDGIYIFMLVWLALGYSGIIGSLGFGEIANTAHLGGLISGVVLGFAAAILHKSPQ